MNTAQNHLRVVAPDEERWLTCAEVAPLCGLSSKTLYRLADAGIGFPAIRVGTRNWRFVLSEVKAFIRGNPDAIARASAEHGMNRAPRKKKEAAP